MALFPLFRQRANEAQLERQVSALQTALVQCKAVARHWRDTRYEVIAVVAAVFLALGFTAGVYREPLFKPAVKLAQKVGLVEKAPSFEAAQAAFQKTDYAAAMKLARPLAEEGDPRAEALLGQLYYRGHGVGQDNREAVTWFQRAADKGDTTAQFFLGGMYTEGRGVPQDFKVAAKWYERAAVQGDGQAQYNLGLAYARGEGVTQDLVKAHMWFNLSAARLTDPRGRTAAQRNRDQVAGEMSSEQLAEAQKMARSWQPKQEAHAQ